ncbi:ubiquitin carboxyl-terminal hydrolase 19-like isoform X2 [Archocentrus centrarchus]|uniref:ubiquitin carboxyl-terminal hydrolase 19-like isoform X2 n=1 Tax=Archocentrus centrarchus TaxID=63155 RepID=UPI0011EA307A|nr:ubiquitin carboxyl-terminal hydrolase 19-like isoform X2 [Archocentrus centrarchus]XP_030609126.1 ubiquitin carboxyl-terminal hydrolase 19-like isoform X2 [Archocentrus centrarchus]
MNMYLLESARQLFNNTSQGNKYHGLMNQGATCYLNSVLQVLFMTKDFREAVTRFSDENPHTEFIDHHLKALFDDLQKYTTYTYNITKKLGIDNVNEQRDAAEYFERVLRKTSHEASKIFHGKLANKTTCHRCHTETDRDAPFWHLPLSLVESCSEVYSVMNGIEEYFKPSVLCGENQMYCDECDEKVDATLRDVIKYHPDVLILLLKRFEFNYDYMSYVKISCPVEVPYTLQIPESQTYELYAVVDHFGNLRCGHYRATIKIQEEKDQWFNFDDTSVTSAAKQKDHTERSQTAYILFYRKKEDECGPPEKKRRKAEDEATAALCNDPVNVVCTDKDKDETEVMSPEFGAAEVSPPLSLNVDHSESEVHVETLGNEGTGVNELNHKEGVDDVRQSRPDNNHDIKPEVRSAVCDHVNKDETRDSKTGKDGNNEDKQLEKKSHEDDPHDEELDDYRQTTDEHQGGEEKTGKDSSVNPAHVHDTNGKTDSDKPTTEVSFNKLQDKEEVDESKENIKEDQSQKQRKQQSDHNDTLNMQEISVTHSADESVCVERQNRNVTEDRRGKEGRDIQASMEKQVYNQGVEHKDMSRLCDFGQNTAEKLSSTSTTHKDVQKQTKEQKNKGDPEKIQTREKSSQRRQETMIEEAERNKNIRAGSSQSDVRAGNQGVTEGEHHSQKSEPQKTDEEIRETAVHENSETKSRRLETAEKTSEHSTKRSEKIKRKAKKKSSSSKVSMNTLSSSVDSLTLNESNLPEKQKQGTKKRKHKEDERISPETTELPNLELEAPAVKNKGKKRGWFKSKKKEKSHKSAKPKKTPGCALTSCFIQASDSN